MKERISFNTIFQKPSTGNFSIFPRNHLTCWVLPPGGAYVFTKSISGGAIRKSRNKNGTKRSNKYASQGDEGGRVGKYIASDMILTETSSAMNVTFLLSWHS
jgi:hypothetical protein